MALPAVTRSREGRAGSLRLAERGGLVGVAPGKRRIFGQVARLPDAFNKSVSDNSRPPVPACRRSFGVGQTNVFGLVGMC